MTLKLPDVVVVAVLRAPVAVFRTSTVAPATGVASLTTVPEMEDVVSCAVAGTASAPASETEATLAVRKILVELAHTVIATSNWQGIRLE